MMTMMTAMTPTPTARCARATTIGRSDAFRGNHGYRWAASGRTCASSVSSRAASAEPSGVRVRVRAGSFDFPLRRRRAVTSSMTRTLVSRFTVMSSSASIGGSDGEIEGGERGAFSLGVDADADALLSSVKTTTTWGGDWAEFVIFLARLQAMGYSGASADVASGDGGGDSNVPEWARGVSGGARTVRSDEGEREEAEEEDLTPTDPGEIKRLALSFCRDRPDLYARLPERLVYQLVDWPIARSMNNRKLNAGVQRLRQSLDMDPSHLRGKCSACDKIQERQPNPALRLSDLMRVILALSEIDDPEEYGELPPKEAASDVIRRLLRAADSPKPSPENMPVDTSTVSVKSASLNRRSRFDDGGGRGRGWGRGRGRDEGGRGRGRGRGRDYDSWDGGGGERNRRFGRGDDFNRRDESRGGFDRRRDDEYRGGGRDQRRPRYDDDRPDRRQRGEFGSRFRNDGYDDRGGGGRGGFDRRRDEYRGGGGRDQRRPRYGDDERGDDRSQRGEFGGRFRNDRYDDRGGGGRGGFDRRRDEYRGGGGRDQRRPRYGDDERGDDRSQRGEFGGRFRNDRYDDGRASSFRNNRDGFRDARSRDRYDDAPRGERRHERQSYDNEGFRRPGREPRRSFDDRDSNEEGFDRRRQTFDDDFRRRDDSRPSFRSDIARRPPGRERDSPARGNSDRRSDDVRVWRDTDRRD